MELVEEKKKEETEENINSEDEGITAKVIEKESKVEEVVKEEKTERVKDTKIEEKKEEEYKISKENNKLKIFLFIIILLMFAVAFVGFAIFNNSNTKIISGVKVREIAVSGLSKEEAIALLEETISKEEKEITINIDNQQYKIKPSEIEVQYNIESAVNKAYEIGRTGNIFERNFETLKTMIKKQNIELGVSYNEELFGNFITDIKSKIPGAMESNNYYIEGNKLIIVKGKAGLSIDEELLKALLIREIQSGQYNEINLQTQNTNPEEINIEKIYEEIYSEAKNAYYVKEPFQVFAHENGISFDIEKAKKILEEDKEKYEIELIITEPEIKTDEIGTEAFPDLLSSYTTRYDEGNVTRSINLKLAAKNINGKVLMPNEVFSYNKEVGERTTERGFRAAAGFQGGKVVQMIGGGICQVSSTLYNTVVYANLGITERHNHMFAVDYVDIGTDATVVYGSLDFKFKNTRQYPIMIKTSAQNGKLKIEIFGVKEETEYDVEISSTILSYISYRTIYEDDASLKKGVEKVTQYGSSGCKTITYKILKLDGKEISREVLSKDTYNPMNKYVTRGTKETKVEESTNTSTKPEKEPENEDKPEVTPEEKPETTKPEVKPETDTKPETGTKPSPEIMPEEKTETDLETNTETAPEISPDVTENDIIDE